MRHEPKRAIYDQVEDALTSITLQLRSAIHADVSMPPRSEATAGNLVGPLGRPSDWARTVSAELGSVLLSTLGLAATIEWHLHQFRKCTRVLCELRVNNSEQFDLPEDHAETLFDIYNEALSNVARHSRATRVVVALVVTPQEATLTVHDNGIGLDREASPVIHGGIAGMRALAANCKGRCELDAIRNGGTRIIASLPIAHAPN